MKDNNALSWITSAITFITGIASTEEVARVVLLIIGCVSAVVSLSYNIYCWWKKATEDGKITAKELDEAKKMIDNTIEDIKDLTDKEEK